MHIYSMLPDICHDLVCYSTLIQILNFYEVVTHLDLFIWFNFQPRSWVIFFVKPKQEICTIYEPL